MTKRVARKPDVSRRNFLQKAVAGAGATAAALAGRGAEASGHGAAQVAAGAVSPIRVPAEFAAASAAAPVRFEFPMTGAQVFARACKDEGWPRSLPARASPT